VLQFLIWLWMPTVTRKLSVNVAFFNATWSAQTHGCWRWLAQFT
jgi:hypothetical protein